MRKQILVVVGALLFVSATGAQSVDAQTPSRVVVNATAPIFVRSDAAMIPLIAKEGSALNVISTEGDWYRVEFQDPQHGPRVGYIEKRHVTALPTARTQETAIDLTIAEATPAHSRMAAQERPNTDRVSSQTAARFPAREPGTRPWGETSPWPQAYVIGRSGMTFGTRTAPLIGAEVGGQIAPFLQAYGSFDWHRDISPSFVEDIGEIVSYIVDADVNYRFPTFAGAGGLKVISPRGTIRPYGLGGVGYGRVKGTVEVEGEDVTELLDEFGFLDRDDISFNKMLFEAGAGISMSSGRTYVDIGYRFRKFMNTSEPINMSGLYAGVGVGF